MCIKINPIAKCVIFKYIFIVYIAHTHTIDPQCSHHLSASPAEHMQLRDHPGFKASLVKKGRVVQTAQRAQQAQRVQRAPPVILGKPYVITHSQYQQRSIMPICHLHLSEQSQSHPAGTLTELQILIQATLHGTMKISLNPTNCACRGLNKRERTFTSF